MNCTAWNSVLANADRNRPIDMPSSAFSTANTTTSTVEPATSRPSRPIATTDTVTACTVAITANASP